VQVVDATGQSLLISSAAQLTDCAIVLPCPDIVTVVTASTPVACYGESTGSLSVQSSGGQDPYVYNWQQGQNVGDTWSNIPSGNYTIISTDANGCADTLAVTLDSPPVFELSLVSSVSAGCNSSSGSATVSITGGSGTPTISWSPIGGNALTATGLIGGSYVVTALDANNCEASLTVLITEPSVSITGDTLLCPGESTQLLASSLNLIDPISYVWSTGSVGTTITESPAVSTNYTVAATDFNGCSVSSSIDVVVENLNWNISANPLQGFIPFQVNFVNQSTPALNYTWDFGNGLNATSAGNESTSSLYSNPGVYTVTVNSNGNCPDAFTLLITALTSQPLIVLVPTIFTFGTDGLNDAFTIFSENAVTQEAQIFNRWGQVVAELNAPNAVWDGFVNGNEAADGTYYIIYNVQGDNSQQIEGSGYFQKISK
jgi:gliding motility-associated-like protein